jgi:hypothetical protein
MLGHLAPAWVFRAGTWVIAVVFFVRAIGDFKWIGFFKRRTGTRFAALDSALYSPLCLSLAVACTLLAAWR